MGLSLRRIQRGRKKKKIRRESREIPMDLVMEEILTRLPAKTLMRFKCVSKHWSSLISSRYFSKRFHKFPSAPRLYMCLRDLNDHRNSLTLSLAPDNTSTTLPSSSFVVDNDMTIPRMGSNILQNLRGLMCYTCLRKPRIYNPATRQLVTLPAAVKSKSKSKNIIPPPAGQGNKKTISYYFGHDPVKDQYKVVRSTCVYLERLQDIRSEHWVFVLNKPGRGRGRGYWKKAAPNTTDFHPHIPAKGGVCIDGVIYYLAWTRLYKVVLVSFHVRTQDFKMIQVPLRDGVEDLPGRSKNMSLMEYRGNVTVIDQSYLRDNGMLDLWVVEDAGNKKWSMKTLVLQPSQLHLVNNTTTTFNVEGTIQKGDQVLLMIPQDLFSPFHLLCYDLQSNDMRKIEIKGIPEHWFSKDKSTVCFNFMNQSESLIYI